MSINVVVNNPTTSISFWQFVLYLDSLTFVQQVVGVLFLSPGYPQRLPFEEGEGNWHLIDNLTALKRGSSISSSTGNDGYSPNWSQLSDSRIVELLKCCIQYHIEQITESLTHNSRYLEENELWGIAALHQLPEIFCSIGPMDFTECR